MYPLLKYTPMYVSIQQNKNFNKNRYQIAHIVTNFLNGIYFSNEQIHEKQSDDMRNLMRVLIEIFINIRFYKNKPVG